MPRPLQLKLLRFLQDGSYRPLGQAYELRSSARVIAATNQSLGELVARGVFREDLWYRLKMLQVKLPPLAERAGDVVLIARHFLATDGDLRRRGLDLSEAACEILLGYPWPGNVRELQATLLEASVRTAGCTIEANILMQILNWSPLIPELRTRNSIEGVEAEAGPGPMHLPEETIEAVAPVTQSAVIEGLEVNAPARRGPQSPREIKAAAAELEREALVLKALKANGRLTRRELEWVMQLSERTANRLLQSLEQQGRIVAVGKGRAREYRLPRAGEGKLKALVQLSEPRMDVSTVPGPLSDDASKPTTDNTAKS
jgi:DNA-binding NtrC family response regulator